MNRRGVSLLELLLSLSIVVMVAVVSGRALNTALIYQDKLRASSATIDERTVFEDKIRVLLQHAYLSPSTTYKASYFIGEVPQVVNTTNTGSGTGLPRGLQSNVGGQSTPNGGAGGSGATQGSGTGAYGTPNVMVFTVRGMKFPDNYLASNDDFETLNQEFGPQGGLQEIEISETPVGGGGQGQTGIFLRTQVPSDYDPTQGGNEMQMEPNLQQIGFEFFDGENWDQSWDTRSQNTTPGKLPAAVRITYRFTNDTYDHVFVVQLPNSSVTYLNPVTVTG